MPARSGTLAWLRRSVFAVLLALAAVPIHSAVAADPGSDPAAVENPDIFDDTIPEEYEEVPVVVVEEKAPAAPADASGKPTTGGGSPATGSPGAEDEETRLGRRAASEIETEYKLLRDPVQLARLERIGQDIAAVCHETSYRYTFKILDTDDINAVSLPGGFTYVTKGMLTYVRSDHELAGVLAHEIAHAARHHVRDLLRRSARANQHIALGILGAVLLGGGNIDGLGDMMFGAEMLKAAYMTGHSQDAEYEADRCGVEYLLKCGKYNPVGALTLMERLARDEANREGPPMGIFRTHPPGHDRARVLEEFLKKHGVPINRLAVLEHLHAVAREASEGETGAAEVVFNGMVVYRTAQGLPAAQALADQINRFMQGNPQPRDVRVGPDGVSVMAGRSVLLTVTAADAELEGKSAAEVAAEAARNIARALWKAHVEQVA